MGLSLLGVVSGGQEMLLGGPQAEFRSHQLHEGAASWTPIPQASLTLTRCSADKDERHPVPGPFEGPTRE